MENREGKLVELEWFHSELVELADAIDHFLGDKQLMENAYL